MRTCIFLPLLFLFACSVKGSYENNRADLEELESHLCATVVFANDSRYATAKLQHVGVFQFEPFAVVYATCEQDVVEFVNFVNSVDGIQFRIRSGGHSFGGFSNCDDCIILDLSLMQDATIDPASNKATLGPGVDNEILVRFMTDNDRMVPHGFCPSVRMGGLGQVGGTSYLSRSLGLAVDYIESVNIVTADGTLRTCSYDGSVEDQSLSGNGCSDLLWAVRGSGGGQWGVVTSYTLRTNELVPPRYTYGFRMGFLVTDESLRHWAQWVNMELANSTLDNSLAFVVAVVSDTIATTGQFMIAIRGWWYGNDYEYGRMYVQSEIVAEFNVYDSFFLVEYLNMTYHELYTAFSAAYQDPPAANTASRLIFDGGLNDAYVDELLDYLNALSSNTTSYVYQGYFMATFFELFNEVTQNEALIMNTSFPNRGMLAYTQFVVQPPTLDAADIDESNAICDDFYRNILSLLGNQSYVGYKDAYQKSWQDNYFGRQPELYGKLVTIKQKYDPSNLFYDGVAFEALDSEEGDSAAAQFILDHVLVYTLFLACAIAGFF